ncbi:FecR domain-containing protein [Sphingomonas sp. RRHST34]|uniref:FecR domain-containing protein n=1 Tax=Sphingomonas citri TaxID=2862499 RepID=A0ABS7BST5_9SPHN|nr:FecR domain-containing protein [Sphingomonas citri]MBW6532542.1 FecR domain-containing protein [Sphingomonas citri]
MTRIDEEAVDWAARVADRDFTDWDGFTTWLEADAARSARYDAAVLALAGAERTVAQLPAGTSVVATASQKPGPARPHAGRWLGAAAAAAVIGAIGVTAWQERAKPYAVETRAGEQRVLALADGSSVILAGGSRVMLDRADQRRAIVEAGEALFRVRHDAARPFRVDAGGLALTDIGTVFDVKRAGALTRVAVSEGAVLVDPDGAALRLDAGETVVAEGDRLVEGRVAVSDVGAWHEGRLAYDGAPLGEVAADLSRQLGRRVRVSPAVATRQFQGTLDLPSLRSDPATLGALLDVRVHVDASGWTLEPRE